MFMVILLVSSRHAQNARRKCQQLEWRATLSVCSLTYPKSQQANSPELNPANSVKLKVAESYVFESLPSHSSNCPILGIFIASHSIRFNIHDTLVVFLENSRIKSNLMENDLYMWHIQIFIIHWQCMCENSSPLLNFNKNKIKLKRRKTNVRSRIEP